MSFRSGCTISHHSRVNQVQIDLLASLYLLSTGQVTRAWSLCEETNGLHVDLRTSALSENFKEERCRLWWSLCGLHYHLSVMTGRPSLLAHGMATETLDTVNSESARTFSEKNSADLDMDQLYFAELSKLVSIG
ncbi:hypothetical protein ASPCAL09152 [Aspergillus calidoustus]|uniref:Transcription factor domain-containing protein n=1 Tax=Aspergillus calidoustus TaxID=454130 RepID=A0A0U5GSA8_ASPCI|nr:hypothetical protein ASPCAL09152 [Aspergillus calidoustus]